MKIKIAKKAILILLLTLLFTIMIMPKSLAGITPGQISGEVSGGTEIDVTFVEKLENAIRFIGIFLAIGVLMVLGIKYMAGSIEERASYKKSMMPYLIRSILLISELQH